MKILQYPHKMLKTKCEEVKVFDSELSAKITEMTKTMILNEGMGLAANQIGLKDRIFVMTPLQTPGFLIGLPIELVNPVILKKSGKADLNEACLSSPGISKVVESRADKVKVAYKTRTGEVKESTFYGIDAVCVQHELDHLNGIHFLEKE